MNKRKNLWILFSLILVFFFVGCSDFYQDMGGSSIEMSFKVPEKIDARSLDSRSDTETDISTYKLVVKLESKNELLDKIEKNVCSGEIVNLAFTNVKKGKTVKVSAQLFQDGKSVYFGESDWINTTKGKNYAKVVLEKDYRPLVPTVVAIDDCIKFNVNNVNSEIIGVAFIANIEYEQNLSVQLQEKTEEGWKNYESETVQRIKEPTFLSCVETIQLNIGESKVLRAAFTNSVTTETGKINSVTVYSNEVTLAYVNIDDYSLKHDKEYVIYGEEINKDDFELFANYTLNGNEKSAPVTIKNVTFGENSIGNVPFTFEFVVPYAGDTKLTTTIPVPVKYQLNADKLAITAIVNNVENTEATDSGRRLKIAQYTQNVQLSANYDDTLYLYTEGTDNPQPINILVNWASYSGGPSIGFTNTLTIQDETKELLQGLATYECTITPNANTDFIVGESVTKEYFVNVCPWEIKLSGYHWTAPEDFDNTTLNYDMTTYLITLINEASADNNLPFDCSFDVTGEDFYITDYDATKVLSIPNKTTTSQTATITATLKRDGEIIATITHDVVVPAKENSSTSGGTTGGGTGNTEATVSAEYLTFDSVNREMVVKSYEGLKTVAKIINGEIQQGETISISSSEGNGAGFTYSLGDDGLDTIGILLSNNIELDSDWTGIGTEGNPYNGIFNGGNYSIKYNENTKPLFNYAGGSMCKISSLVVNGELTSAEPYLGGIVSSFSGGIIENCVNNAIITNSYSTNDSTATGGIVGYLDNAKTSCTIQNCVNLVPITAKTYVGGIVGHGVSSSNSGQEVTVSKCINIGDIASNSTESGAFQAGIMGASSFNVSYPCISITDCLNKGTIFYNSKTSSGAGIVNVLSSQDCVAVKTSINAGPVNTTSAVMISDSTPTNSYWDKTENPKKTEDNGKTTEELVNGETTLASTFSNWVFNTGNSYPYPNIGSGLPGGEDGETWETVLIALKVELTTGGETSTYQIGDVYSENGTAMGVVFEVAEDDSYIKIVALKDLDNIYTWAARGVFDEDDQPRAYDEDNGDLNFEAIKSYVAANSNYNISLDNGFQIFNYTSQFYQISESEKGEWYVPALNELKAVIQYQIGGKFNNGNYFPISSGFPYWSSTLISGSTIAYYATTNNQEQSQSVETSCYVRPVRKITLEE